MALTALCISPDLDFVATLTGASKSSSVIVRDGVCAAPANKLNFPFVYVNRPPIEDVIPSMTEPPAASIVVKPFEVYRLSVDEPSASVTVWSHVFAADAKPPALVVSLISSDVAFIP